MVDIFAEPGGFGEGSAALVEERVEALRAYSFLEPSVENDETRKLFVKGCQGKDGKK